MSNFSISGGDLKKISLNPSFKKGEVVGIPLLIGKLQK
jgi:hypothetical protein